MALKQELSENRSQRSIRPSQESHSTGAPVRSRESEGSCQIQSVQRSSQLAKIHLKNGRTTAMWEFCCAGFRLSHSLGVRVIL